MDQPHRKNRATIENISDWVHLIQSEYAEMPGLHLSRRQAERLWNLDSKSCKAIFDELEAVHFLRRTLNDAYIRDDIAY